MKLFLVCKLFLVLFLALVLAGCASTKTSITDPSSGVVFSMETSTFFKDVKDVSGKADSEGFQFDLGSSGSALTPEQTQAFACILNPLACKP